MTALLLPTVALFTRAMRDDMRSKYPVIIRTVALLFLLLIISASSLGTSEDPAAGRTLLTMIAMVNFFGLTLYALGSFASAITEEKEDETLPLMRMTRLGPVSILLGKGGARLAGGLLFLSVQIPFTILCVALGGVAMSQILRVYAVLAAYIFFLANLGLLASVLSRRTSRAVMLTFTAGLVIYVLPFFVWFSRFSIFSGVTNAGPVENLAGALLTINPLADLISTLFGRTGFPIGADSPAFHLIGGVVCFIVARLLFEKFCGSDAAAVPRRARAARMAGGRRPRAWRFALGWKDFHFLAGGRKGLFVRFCLYGLLAGGIIAWVNWENDLLTLRQIGETTWTIAIVMFSIELAVAASRIFGTERKAQTLGTIMILPTSAARLAWQKTAGAALGFLSSVALGVLGIFLTNAAERDSISRGAAMEEYGYRAMPAATFPEIIGLSAADLFTVMQYAFAAALIAYLSLRMRRGALLTGLLALFVGNIVVQIIYSNMRAPFWMGTYSDDGYAAFERNFYLTAALVTAVLALLFAIAIPRRLAACAAEE